MRNYTTVLIFKLLVNATMVDNIPGGDFNDAYFSSEKQVIPIL